MYAKTSSINRLTASVLLAFALRIFYALLAWASRSWPLVQQSAVYPYAVPAPRWLFAVWFQWDASWYLGIAQRGYAAAGSTAFAPLFPWLWGRVSHLLGNDPLVVALALNTLLAALTFWAWGELTPHLIRGQGKPGLALPLALFPTAFFLFAPYTEALFLALAGGSWLAARQRRWPLAALLAALATLARFQGVLLGLILAWLALTETGLPTSWQALRRRKAIWWATLPWLAFLGWNAWLHAQGLLTPSAALYARWGIPTVTPWEGTTAFLQRLWTTGPIHLFDWLDLLLLLATLASLFLGWKRLRADARLYLVLTLALLFTRGATPHLFDSFSRYALTLTPLWLLTNQLPRRWKIALGVLSFTAQTFFVLAFFRGAWVA